MDVFIIVEVVFVMINGGFVVGVVNVVFNFSSLLLLLYMNMVVLVSNNNVNVKLIVGDMFFK